MPHGHCYLWNPQLVWLHVVSDGLIVLAYMSIPFTLVYLAHRRRDIPFNWMFFSFGMFIVACGATHAMEIWTLWTPLYWLSGGIKAVTAVASLATAGFSYESCPRLLRSRRRTTSWKHTRSCAVRTTFWRTVVRSSRKLFASERGLSERRPPSSRRCTTE